MPVDVTHPLRGVLKEVATAAPPLSDTRPMWPLSVPIARVPAVRDDTAIALMRPPSGIAAPTFCHVSPNEGPRYK